MALGTGGPGRVAAAGVGLEAATTEVGPLGTGGPGRVAAAGVGLEAATTEVGLEGDGPPGKVGSSGCFGIPDDIWFVEVALGRVGGVASRPFTRSSNHRSASGGRDCHVGKSCASALKTSVRVEGSSTIENRAFQTLISSSMIASGLSMPTASAI